MSGGAPPAPGSVRPAADSERRARGLALGAVALWSTVATGFELGLARFETAQLLLAGSAVSLALFAGLAAARGELAAVARLSARDQALCALLGAINPAAYYLVLFEAYDRLPAQIAQPVNYTWAITLALLSVPVLGQRLAPRTLTGIAIGYAGVVVLLTRGEPRLAPDLDRTGLSLAFASTGLWAVYWLLGARSAIPTLPLMTASFAWGTAAIAVVCGATVGWPAPGGELVLFGGWVGLVEMGIAFLLWQAALRRTRQAARIGQLIFLSPFLSLLGIAFVVGESIHPSAVVGLAVIVAGQLVAGPTGRSDPSSSS